MKQFVPLLLLIGLSGCTPQTTATSVNVEASGSTPIAVFTLQNSGPDVPEIDIRLFPKYESARIIPLTSPPQTQDNHTYKLVLPALPPDHYRLVIDIKTTRRYLGMSLGKATRRINHDFVIHTELPASCFLFDTPANDIAGWTSRGVYFNRHTEQISGDTCPGLFHTNVSWPYALNEPSQGGSLFVPVSSECFPHTPTTTADTGMWHFSIDSPELLQHKEWQGIQAIQFKMATKNIPVTVAPEIEYEHAGRILHTHDDVTPATHYQVSSGRWNSINHTLEIPRGAIIRRVRLHVYGKPEQTISDKVDSIFVDAICPVK